MATLPQSPPPEKPRAFGDMLAPSAAVLPFPGTRPASRDELVRFLNLVFHHCPKEPGWIALRAFEHERDGGPVISEWRELAEGRAFVTAAVDMATSIANRPFERRAVFSPPVALFGDGTRKDGKRIASDDNVTCAPVIVVELDERPAESLAILEGVLGEPTFVVQSGGRWMAPDGAIEDKLHAYWRLGVPARSVEDRALLKRVRHMAADLVGADKTAAALSHPLRWPGGWHTKGQDVRPCRILRDAPDRDVDLADAARKLEAALREARLDVTDRPFGAGPRDGFKTREPWPAEDLAEAARIIPNDGRDWDRWSTIGMAFFDTSHGGTEGLDAFHIWGEKADAYDPDRTDERWDHWSRSPPSHLSEGTLLRETRKVRPGYMPPHQVAQHFVPPVPTPAMAAGPADIFAHEDKAELGIVPAGSLPDIIAAWVRTEAPRKGVPEAFAAVSAVTTAAAAIGTSLRLQVQQKDTSWQEPASLFAVIVADPGSNKSGIISEAAEPLRRLDREFGKDWAARRKVWERADAAFKKASRRAAADVPHPGDEPVCRRVTVDNFTTEKLVRILADNPRGVLCKPDEFSGLLGGLGAYKPKGDDDRALLLRLADGRDVQIDRVGSGTVTAEAALVSILASTQPDVLRRMTGNLGSDGLLQRFTFVLHDGVSRRSLDQEPDHQAVAAYETLIRGLAQDEHPPVACAIRLTPEAGRAMSEGRDALDRLKGLTTAGVAFRGHVEKWGKFLPRLVLVFHAIEEFGRAGHVDRSRMVEAETVETAVRFAHFLMRHSLRFYESFVAADDATSGARVVGEFLLANPDKKEVRPRDITMARKAFQGSDGNRALHDACQQLEAAGWMEAMELRSNGHPVGWRIHPDIHVRFAAHAERAKLQNAQRREAIGEAIRQRAAINGQSVSRGELDVSDASVFD